MRCVSGCLGLLMLLLLLPVLGVVAILGNPVMVVVILFGIVAWVVTRGGRR